MKKIKSYLIFLSLFLLGGFSFLTIYATFLSVNTGDTLSSNSWNNITTKLQNQNIESGDFVTKNYVDSQILTQSSGTSFEGLTSSTYTGDMGGIKGMNDKCSSEYEGSRACKYEELITLGNNYNWTQEVWVLNGSYTNGTYEITSDGYQINSLNPDDSQCNGWNGSNTGYTGPYTTINGNLSLTTCNNQKKLPCCK